MTRSHSNGLLKSINLIYFFLLLFSFFIISCGEKGGVTVEPESNYVTVKEKKYFFEKLTINYLGLVEKEEASAYRIAVAFASDGISIGSTSIYGNGHVMALTFYTEKEEELTPGIYEAKYVRYDAPVITNFVDSWHSSLLFGFNKSEYTSEYAASVASGMVEVEKIGDEMLFNFKLKTSEEDSLVGSFQGQP